MKLRVTISKTADGAKDYLQVLSLDLETNIVLVADEITIQENRPRKRKRKKDGIGPL